LLGAHVGQVVLAVGVVVVMVVVVVVVEAVVGDVVVVVGHIGCVRWQSFMHPLLHLHSSIIGFPSQPIPTSLLIVEPEGYSSLPT